jgi:Na+/pantothenate symporter
VLAGLYSKRAGVPEALAAMISGVAVVVGLQVANGGRPIWSLTPALLGLIAATLAYLVVRLVRR